MGWLYPHHTHTRKALIEDLTRPETWERNDGTKVRRTALRHCCVGNVLWVVYAFTDPATGARLFDPVIVCNLMQKHGTWGYKDMGEEMHPYYYSCPEAYLELTPAPNDNARAWRQGVARYHVDRRERLRKRREARKGVSVG